MRFVSVRSWVRSPQGALLEDLGLVLFWRIRQNRVIRFVDRVSHILTFYFPHYSGRMAQIILHLFENHTSYFCRPMAKILVDAATESFFTHLSFSYICSSGVKHTQYCKMAPFTIHTKNIIHIFVDTWLKLWLIQLLRIFLHTCLFHTYFYQISKHTGFVRWHDKILIVCHKQ